MPAAYEMLAGTTTPEPTGPGASRESHQSPSAGTGATQPVPGGSIPQGDRPTASPAAFNRPHIDRFTHIQNRLQELGATYYLLETLGTQGSYRFYCRMAVGGNATFIKWFEATDPDPLTAMTKVLDEAETWRAERLR